MSTPGRLDGKVALVTGGGRGIGRGIVLEFAREGADVAINFRRGRDAAEATARDVEALGRRPWSLQADVSDREAVDRMVAEVRTAFGRIDVGVANSGVASRVAPVHEIDPANGGGSSHRPRRRVLHRARGAARALETPRGAPLHLLDRSRHGRARAARPTTSPRRV